MAVGGLAPVWWMSEANSLGGWCSSLGGAWRSWRFEPADILMRIRLRKDCNSFDEVVVDSTTCCW